MAEEKDQKEQSVESTVREIRRKTRKKYSAEEKLRIVLEGLRGEDSISEVCRREGICTSMNSDFVKGLLETNTKRSDLERVVSEGLNWISVSLLSTVA